MAFRGPDAKKRHATTSQPGRTPRSGCLGGLSCELAVQSLTNIGVAGLYFRLLQLYPDPADRVHELRILLVGLLVWNNHAVFDGDLLRVKLMIELNKLAGFHPLPTNPGARPDW